MSTEKKSFSKIFQNLFFQPFVEYLLRTLQIVPIGVFKLVMRRIYASLSNAGIVRRDLVNESHYKMEYPHPP